MEDEQHPQPQLSQEQLRYKVMELLNGANYATGMGFGFRLEEAGLLADLEKVGILPAVTNLNPYHPEFEEEQHNRWWDEHPECGEEFIKNSEQREERLKYLYIGAVLGHFFVELISPKR